MRDNTLENNDINNEEIISELEQCREDERNSQNQIIQVIATAGTVLALIFGISSFGKHISLLFHLSNFVLCTTFGYITSLGISAVLRYHYMRDLEDKLLKRNAIERIIHWNSFVSSITTRNPKHMYNIYTKMHYLSYSLSAVCPILFCIIITVYQFNLIEDKSIIDNIGILLSAFFMFLCMIIYFLSSIKAGVIYEKAMVISLQNQNKRLKRIIMPYISVSTNKNGKTTIKNILKVLVYFIYPKKKDLQKLFLLIIGFLTGCFFKNNTYKITIFDLKNMLMVCLIIDFLLYQARYQWNDIRGVKEDTLSGKTDRLPVNILGKYKAIIISSVLLAIRVITVFVIVLHLEGNMRTILLNSTIIILVCAILYELVRSLESVFGTFIVVSFGYAIRFGLGMWNANPEIWNEGFIFSDVKMSRSIIVMLTLAYALLGEYSVILSWLQEALYQKSNGILINKIHYRYLYDQLVRNCKDKNNIVNPSLKQKGKVYDLWNISYIFAIILLLLIVLLTNFNFIILILGILGLTISIIICMKDTKNIKLYIGVLGGIYLLEILYSVYNFNLFNLYIYVTQLIFSCIYIFIRFLFKPDFDFINCCKNIVVQLIILFIGNETYLYLKPDSNKEEK